jgi:hypothetical protein
LFGNGNLPDQGNVADAADEAGGGRLRRMFCEQSLGKVGLRAGLGAKKAFLYYDTDFFGSLLPAGRVVAGIFPSVA